MRPSTIAALAIGITGTALHAQNGEWPAYGRDPGGSRFSPLAQIDRGNVQRLSIAWTFHTGEPPLQPARGGRASLEATPIMVDGTLYLSTPTGKVFALDPTTGQERWHFDAAVDLQGGYGDFTNRGVSTWLDRSGNAATVCHRRIFLASIDARLFALDARTGVPCGDFGAGGSIDLREGLRVAPFESGAYEQTSPPAIVGDLVVTGSGIADNSRVAPASGEVRAWDARNGRLIWSWDPIPQRPGDPAAGTWLDGSAARTGAANAWSGIVADTARGLIFVPTSSAAPDYYGALRPGDNRYANSIVALRAADGSVRWHFQTVHHDLWDYDNPAPPALVSIRREGRDIPAVILVTKTGMMFVFNRETGEPIFPIEERAVPASDIPGEPASPTQPFTALTPALSRHGLTAEDIWGPTPADRDACRAMVAGLRNDGVFTPPSERGTLVSPSNIGGAQWGGVATDPERHLAVVPVNHLAASVQLIPAEGFDRDSAQRADTLGNQFTTMRGTPYVMRRRILVSPSGIPCTRPPFGSLVAIDLRTGQRRWSVPLGDMPGAPAHPTPWGSPNLGGPIVTAGGLVFIAATLDRAFRAFDVETGAELWRSALPAGGKATPMTYLIDGRQFVVVAAGGGGRFGEGDAFVAFALPGPGN